MRLGRTLGLRASYRLTSWCWNCTRRGRGASPRCCGCGALTMHCEAWRTAAAKKRHAQLRLTLSLARPIGQAEQGIKMACAERRYRCDAARGDAAASTRRSPRRRLAFAHNRPLPAFGTSDEGHVANVSAALPKGGDAGIAAQLLAGALWSRGITGAGVRVAVLDSGVVPAHPDFKAGVSSTDWTDEPGGGGEERDWGAAPPCCALRKHKDTKRSRRVSSYDVLQLEQVFVSRSVRDTCAHSQTAAASPARPHAHTPVGTMQVL